MFFCIEKIIAKVSITQTKAERPTNVSGLSISEVFFCPAAKRALPTAAIRAKRKMEETFMFELP